jgi:hypothetical protein
VDAYEQLYLSLAEAPGACRLRAPSRSCRLGGGRCAYHAGVPGRVDAKRALKRAIIAVAGRPLRCELCDEVLTTAAPIVFRGRLLLVGLEREFVAVDFTTVNRLVFRHARAGACAGRRP